MARVTNGLGTALSGRLENIVFVNYGESTYVRTMPRERKPSEWSADQKNHRSCFASVMKYASRRMKTFVKPIWNLVGTNTMSGCNLFVKANKPAFDVHGVLAYPGLLRFSTGTLPLPPDLVVVMKPEQSGVIAVSWKNQIANRMRGFDQLMVVFYDSNELMQPIQTTFLRKDEQAQIAFPESKGMVIWLYLFFRSANQTAYSIDQAFQVTKA